MSVRCFIAFLVISVTGTAYSQVEDTLLHVRPDSVPGLPADPEWDTSYFFPDDPEFNLIMAAERGQLNVVKLLVDRGVFVDASTGEGVTPLMYAAQSGDVSMVDYLISRGASLDARPSNGITALTGAVRAGRYEAAKLLLDAGAEPDRKDFTDLTALMYASAYNYPEIVTLLVEAGADPEMKDWFGTTSLMMAVYYNCYESSLELIRLGADINAQDTFGFTPLMIAVQHGDYDLAWMLLDMGADPNLRNKGGHHAISIAAMNDEPDMIELLMESGARTDRNISPSTNALNLADEMGNNEMVSYLRDLGLQKNRVPEFSGLRFGGSLGFNADDFTLAFEGGVTESKYNTFATTGFIFRPSAIRVLSPENDTLSYQFWEKRYIWPVSAGKDFRLYHSADKVYGLRIQFTGALTWGSYRGSERHPKVRYVPVPSLGFYWKKSFYGITFDYEYVPLHVQDISHHRFRLGVWFYTDLRKRLRFERKYIEWF